MGGSLWVRFLVGVERCPPRMNISAFSALRTNTENTPLQSKLKILAAFIGNAGSMTGIMLFVSLIIKFFVELGTKQSSRCGYSLMSFFSINLSCRTPCEWGIEFLKIFIISITLVVIAVPEGVHTQYLVTACPLNYG